MRREYDCVYADLWGTATTGQFVKEVANAMISSSLFSRKSIGQVLADFIKSIGASVSFGYDGQPSVNLLYSDRQIAFDTLEEVFHFLEQNKKPVLIAIDEFQEIRRYEGGEVLEAKLRSLSERSQNIRFIFSGSEHELLSDIFTKYKAPFYQSTRMMELKKIDALAYTKFIQRHFKKGGKELPAEIIDHILTITYRHTYYVQAICNLVYGESKAPGSINEFEGLYMEYISEKQVFYSELPHQLTKSQFSTLKAFSRAGAVTSPYAAEFIKASGVDSASSMQRVIRTLLDKKLIISDDGAYRLYDLFLEHYLKYFS
jgi:AAA+ ATPase superfamily predicted ATPase